MKPLISIITVVYNNENTILNTVRSVLNQSYRNIEYIIIDGKSSDNTLKKIEPLKDKISKIISEKDSGIYDAMNKGINNSSGDIVGFLNSDDVFYDNYSLEFIAKVFIDKKNADCVYGNLIFINQNNDITRNWISCQYKIGLFEKSWTPAHPTFYCRRKVFEKIGYFNLKYKIAADVEFMLRALRVNKLNSIYINKTLVKMRTGGISNNGLKSKYIIAKEMYNAFAENNLSLNIFKYVFYKALKLKQYIN
jgi:glycosyltransferase involved in cell wall biosynthesis